MKNALTKSLILFSILGMAVTGYLIDQHYKPAGTSVCNINEYINCDIVNKSEYSEIFGIPVSILGFMTYVAFFSFGMALYHGKKLAVKNLPLIFAFSVVGLLFSLYLTYIEFFVLFAVCMFCITQQIFILIITLLLGTLLWRSKKSLHR